MNKEPELPFQWSLKERIRSRIVRSQKPIIRAIAATILVIVAIWYVRRILFFNSLSEPDAEYWLGFSDIALMVSAVLVVVGLFGEFPDSDAWKKTSLYEAAKWGVIIGIGIELLGDAGVYRAGERVHDLDKKAIGEAMTRAANAEETLVAYRAQRHVSDGQKERLEKVTKRYPATSFVAVTSIANEPWIFLLELSRLLRKDGWNWLPVEHGLQANDGSPAEGVSILSHIQINASPGESDVAYALRDAIFEPETVGMGHIVVDITPNAPIMTIFMGTKE